jgi:hypothetical protein
MKSIGLALLLLSALAHAQDAKDGGGKPGDGAIIRKGEVLPGESAGRPEARSPVPSPSGAERCNELSGTLREQCLEQEHRASSGATRAPGEPPPQEPRQEKQ